MTWQGAIETTVTGLGYELVDAEKSVGGLLRVFIDHAAPEGSEPRFINVDDCEKVTRQLQYVLEVEGCGYERLEVSSPGLDRPLRKEADYRRFKGEEIELSLKLPFKGRKKYRGELQARADGWRLVLPAEKAGTEPQALDFLFEEVREARLVPVIDFKGRRIAPHPQAPAVAGGADEPHGGREVDGGLI